MKSHSLTRRLLAGAAGLMIGATGAVAFATPAFAHGEREGHTAKPSFKSFTVTGSAICDEETGDSTVEWTVTNTSLIHFVPEITNVVVEGDLVGDLAVGAKLPKGEQVTGAQTFPAEAESASIEVELTWTWHEWEWNWVSNWWGWGKHLKLQKVEKTKTKTESADLDLTECDVPPEPDPSIPPNVITLFSCDDLVFIVDNVGNGEATVELTPNTTVGYGPATGFSYSLDPETNEVEPIVDEGASIDLSDEADESNPVVVGPVAAGSDPVAVGFEGLPGLEITISLTVDGEAWEFEEGEDVVSFDDAIAGLDCDGGEGGELPVTGVSTGLIALAAVALLALGGGLFMVARRRRVTFTA